MADDFHEDDGIGEVDEVPVAVANQLAELLLLILDMFSGGAFDISYFRNGFGAEKGRQSGHRRILS